MNSVELVGRLVRDPEQRQSVTSFVIACDRPTREGEEKQADFPRITTFGKQAEVCARYLKKGRLVAIQGRIQTGSYEGRDGKTVHTTDVVANRVDFLDAAEKKEQKQGSMFETADEYMPF